MLLIGAGLAVWYFMRQRGVNQRNAEIAVTAANASRPMATDTMMPGSIGPAIAGIIKKDGALQCLSCY